MNEDPLVTIDGGDPEMNAAIKRAQETFPEFAKEVGADSRRVIPACEVAVLKVFFPDAERPDTGEHMFVDGVWLEGERVNGTLASSPQSVAGLEEGQAVSFPVKRISDWFLVRDGVASGGHTLKVLASRMTKDEYAEASQYPPFAWFD